MENPKYFNERAFRASLEDVWGSMLLLTASESSKVLTHLETLMKSEMDDDDNEAPEAARIRLHHQISSMSDLPENSRELFKRLIDMLVNMVKIEKDSGGQMILDIVSVSKKDRETKAMYCTDMQLETADNAWSRLNKILLRVD